jgi:MoxR-like ATPase
VSQETPIGELHHEGIAVIERLNDAISHLKAEVGKAIIGQNHVMAELLLAIFAGGHCLLIGAPGLAKTLMIHTLADALNVSYDRIPIMPELMPSDITGVEVVQEDKATGVRQFKFLRGPIFCNLVHADGINRMPSKTQFAFLEAMGERQVTVNGERHRLPDPFFVLATQNTSEYEGTYPLLRALLDRFMLNILVDFPDQEEELDIVRMTTSTYRPGISKVLSGSDILRFQMVVRNVPVARYLIEYSVRLVRMTRPDSVEAPDFIRDFVSFGAGPRASQHLILAAKAHAVLYGRYRVTAEDIQAVAPSVLRHRIVTKISAEAEGILPNEILTRLLKVFQVAEKESEYGSSLPNLF